VPWYDVNWGVLRNEEAFSLLVASVAGTEILSNAAIAKAMLEAGAAAPVLGTEILSKVTHGYEGRPVNEYTTRNKKTGIIYKVFFDGSSNCPRCQGLGV
jgi:hypothetical protein